MKGSTHRRCGCRDPKTKQQLGSKCPKRSQRGHGSWSWKLELPNTHEGERQYATKGGYATKEKAQGDMDLAGALLTIPDEDDEGGRRDIAALLLKSLKDENEIPDHEETLRRFKHGAHLSEDPMIDEWFDRWHKNLKIRKSGKKRYETDIRVHIKPRLGKIRVSKLRKSRIDEMFTAIDETNEEIAACNIARRQVEEKRKQAAAAKVSRAEQRAIVAELRAMPPFRRVTGRSTQRRILATLRAGLNAAVAEGIISTNPAEHVKISVNPPRARVWTAKRVEQWRKTGQKPYPVMVWTPEQLGEFLDFIADHRLYSMFHTIAHRGLRRGEACGARDVDLNLDEQHIDVTTQLVYDTWTNVEESEPKTDSSDAPVALDSGTVIVLREWLAQRQAEKEAAGDDWADSGRIWVTESGEWIHPGWLSEEFERLVRASGLPPIRLHDLRHLAATLMLKAGVDSKVIQQMLRHRSVKTTNDVYTSVLPDLALDAAEKAARIVPRSSRTSGHTSVTQTILEVQNEDRTDDAA